MINQISVLVATAFLVCTTTTLFESRSLATSIVDENQTIVKTTLDMNIAPNVMDIENPQPVVIHGDLNSYLLVGNHDDFDRVMTNANKSIELYIYLYDDENETVRLLNTTNTITDALGNFYKIVSIPAGNLLDSLIGINLTFYEYKIVGVYNGTNTNQSKIFGTGTADWFEYYEDMSPEYIRHLVETTRQLS